MEIVPLFGKVYAAGQPNKLLILHGLFGMGDNWASLAKEWADLGWEVHALDARNHGRSPHHPEHNYDAMVADTMAYMDRHNLERPVVLGHSMGGKTAMHLAVTHPERVGALVVVDIAPKAYPIHHQVYIDAMRGVQFEGVKRRGEVEEQLATLVGNAGIRQFFMKSLHRSESGQFAFRFNLEALDKHLALVGTPLEFGHYMGPVLFVAGALSGYIKPEDHEEIYAHFPDAEIKVIPNAGHWVHAEAREAFHAVIVQFLDERCNSL